MKLQLSIIITTRNRYFDLSSCLQSISDSVGLNLNYEVIVVDDASTDATSKIDAEMFQLNRLIILRNSVQQMMVRSRNTGAKLAIGKFLLFIDDDNVIDPYMISYLLDFAEENQEYAILGPKMCYYPSKKPYLCYQKFNFFTGKTTAYVNSDEKEICESDGIPNVFLIRKEYFEQYGYFDEDIVQTYTEPDVAFSARQRGYKCAMVQKALTYHRILESKGAVHLGGHQFRQKAYFLMRNRTLMIVRYGKNYHQFIYFIFFCWFWPLIYSLLVVREKRFDLIKLYWIGYWDGCKYFFTRKLTESSLVIGSLQNLCK